MAAWIKPPRDRCAMQLEKGEEGTVHVQGVLQFKTQHYRMSVQKKLVKIFGNRAWIKKSTNVLAGQIYCTKEKTRHTAAWSCVLGAWPEAPEKVRDPLEEREPFAWQQVLLDMCACVCEDDRAVYWIVDEEGNVGKSALVKSLVIRRPGDVLFIDGGKGADIKFSVYSHLKPKKPTREKRRARVVLWDLPRSSEGRVSYNAMEGVKNGLIFSTKFESGSIAFNTPHLIIMSNWMPDTGQMSKDRWRIGRVKDHALYAITMDGEEEESITNWKCWTPWEVTRGGGQVRPATTHKDSVFTGWR